MTRAPTIRVAFRDQLGAFALDAAFEAPAVGVTGLFGPSGCGKTSVLRAIAGLLRPREGYCAIGADIWQDGAQFRPAHRRPVGYVFQEASLFPHLSVRGNLLFGAGRPGAAAIGFDETVELLGLSALLDRAPQKLSGGERQRVAIGRALLSRPSLLLMDEPLAALDRAAKDDILPFLERLHARLALPAIYVSHDIGEIERLADHLIVMEAGRVRAAGPLAEVQSDPASPLAVARDAAVSLDARVESYDAAYGLATLTVAGARFQAPTPPVASGASRRLRIAAANVSLACVEPAPSTILNVARGRILVATPAGAHEMVAVVGLGSDGAGARLLSRVTRRSWDRLELGEGAQVYVQVKSVSLTERVAG